MGRITVLGVIALAIAVVSAAPAPQTLPFTCLPISSPPNPAVLPCPSSCQTPSPCEEVTEPAPNNEEEIKVQAQKNTIPERLRQIGFRGVSVPGGTFYIHPTPNVLIQPPPILVKPAKQPPINPPAITVQPPHLPPITPNSIVVRPPRPAPITSPPVLARPKPLAPIQPPPVIVRPPKPAKIQPAPISVTQPKPDHINPPQIVVRQPCLPTLQPPTVCIQTSALQNHGIPPENSDSMYSFNPPYPLTHAKQN